MRAYQKDLEVGATLPLYPGMLIQFLSADVNAPIFLVEQTHDRDRNPRIVLSILNEQNNPPYSCTAVAAEEMILGRNTGFSNHDYLSKRHAKIHWSEPNFVYEHLGQNSARIILTKSDDIVTRIENTRALLNEFSQVSHQAARVQKLEESTNPFAMLMESGKEGYYPNEALRGYGFLLRAFMEVNHEILHDEDMAKLHRASDILNQLEKDTKLSKKSPEEFTANKLRELQQKGEIYLNAGFRGDEKNVGHYNVVRITRLKDGTYRHTHYDAGAESEVLRRDRGNTMVSAIVEHQIQDEAFDGFLELMGQSESLAERKSARLGKLIGAYVAKSNALYNSPEYRSAIAIIKNIVTGEPIRVVDEPGQHKGNCTTRGQRLLLKDVLGDKLAGDMYNFVSNPDNFDVSKIHNILTKKLFAYMRLAEIKKCKIPVTNALSHQISRAHIQEHTETAPDGKPIKIWCVLMPYETKEHDMEAVAINLRLAGIACAQTQKTKATYLPISGNNKTFYASSENCILIPSENMECNDVSRALIAIANSNVDIRQGERGNNQIAK